MSTCHLCKRKFKTEASRDQHARDKHGASFTCRVPGMTKEAALAVMDGMDDLPDGAFFAMAEELGLTHTDFIDEE